MWKRGENTFEEGGRMKMGTTRQQFNLIVMILVCYNHVTTADKPLFFTVDIFPSHNNQHTPTQDI